MAATSAPTSSKRLRILMLHGFTQSGPLFHSKTRALEKNLKKTFPHPTYDLSMHYPTGPCVVRPPDIPNFSSTNTATPTTAALDGASSAEDCYGWFVRKGQAEPYVYERFSDGLATVAETMRREGPFDGVVGFSQGGFMAGTVAALLEPGRKAAFAEAETQGGMPFPESFLRRDGDEDAAREDGVFHAPLKFAVSYSGFGATPNSLYAALYSPKIRTPLLHFLGSVDTVVEEARSLRLVDACEVGTESNIGQRRLVYHPGGHFVPASQRQCLLPLLGFIMECMAWQGQEVGSRGKEDLDLPF